MPALRPRSVGESALARLWARRRERPLLVAAVGALLVATLAYPFLDWHLRGLYRAGVPGYDWVSPFTFYFGDFGVFTSAVTRYYYGQSIYWTNDGSYFATYLYPPVYLLLFLPFWELTTMPGLADLPLVASSHEAGGVAFGLTGVLVLWVGLQAMARTLGCRLAWPDRLVLGWALLGFQPLLYAFKLGQVSAFVAGTFCLAYVAKARGARPGARRATRVASGALTTLAAGIKPYYATAGAHLLRDRDRLLGAFGALAALVALSVALFGVEAHWGYLDVLTWGKGWGEPPRALYLWHPGRFEPLYLVAVRWPDVAVGIQAAVVGAVVAATLAARNADAGRATFALGLATYPLVGPEVYTQDLVALLPAAALLVAVELERDGVPWLPVVAVLLVHAHAHLLRVLLESAPETVALGVETAAVFQPGLWGVAALFALAFGRVVGAAGDLSRAGSRSPP